VDRNAETALTRKLTIDNSSFRSCQNGQPKKQSPVIEQITLKTWQGQATKLSLQRSPSNKWLLWQKPGARSTNVGTFKMLSSVNMVLFLFFVAKVTFHVFFARILTSPTCVFVCFCFDLLSSRTLAVPSVFQTFLSKKSAFQPCLLFSRLLFVC
jgi:hypothetical protein